MRHEQIELVQSSFAKVAPAAGSAALLFYNRLFELDPSLRSLFRGDVREQGRKLMQMLALAVEGLNDPDSLLPALRALGERHATYGARERDYETVGVALIWTLEQGLGEAFTPAVKDAWLAVYSLIAGTMQDAAVAA